MTITKKFSQFNGPSPIGPNDIVVGLRSDPAHGGALNNWQFSGVGSGGGGGGGAVTQTITQPGHNFVPGNWLRVDVATMIYTRAQADTPQDAEVIGVVISSNIPAGTFVLQQSGYLTSAAIVPPNSIGIPQFLSPSVAGAMQPMDTIIDGEISRPCFIPDGQTTGWVLPYRGIIDGGGPDTGVPGPTPPGGTDSNITTITQNGHGFNIGQWVRVSTPNTGLMQPVYVLAIANNLADAQGVGLVIAPITANTFTLQFAGYVQNGVIPILGAYPYVDGGVVAGSTVYYISAIHQGNISTVNPSALGTISKPAYISEQTTVGVTSTGKDTGWVVPQRPLDISPTGADDVMVRTIVAGNSFHIGQWVYISADGTYSLANATTLDTAQVAGVVIATDSSSYFTIQQAGFITGVVNGTYTDQGAPVASGPTVYYLSTTPGNLTTIVPSAGQVSKPCYIQEILASNTGEILPQRPLIVTNPAPGGSGLTFIASRTASNSATVNFDSLLTGAFDDYVIIFEDVLSSVAYDNMCVQVGTAGAVYQTSLYQGATTIVADNYNTSPTAQYSYNTSWYYSNGFTGTQPLEGASIASTDTGQTYFCFSGFAPNGICGEIRIYGVNNTSNGKVIKNYAMGNFQEPRGAYNPIGPPLSGFRAGYIDNGGWWTGTAVVTSLRIITQSSFTPTQITGNILSGTFKLYGYQN